MSGRPVHTDTSESYAGQAGEDVISVNGVSCDSNSDSSLQGATKM